MVTRYNIDVEGEETTFYSYESACGDYVMYEDYESLEADYNVLRRDYESLQAGLKKLYLES